VDPGSETAGFVFSHLKLVQVNFSACS